MAARASQQAARRVSQRVRNRCMAVRRSLFFLQACMLREEWLQGQSPRRFAGFSGPGVSAF